MWCLDTGFILRQFNIFGEESLEKNLLLFYSLVLQMVNAFFYYGVIYI